MGPIKKCRVYSGQIIVVRGPLVRGPSRPFWGPCEPPKILRPPVENRTDAYVKTFKSGENPFILNDLNYLPSAQDGLPGSK